LNVRKKKNCDFFTNIYSDLRMIRNCRPEGDGESGGGQAKKTAPSGRESRGGGGCDEDAGWRLLGGRRLGLGIGLGVAHARPGTPAPGTGLGAGTPGALAALVSLVSGTGVIAGALALTLPLALAAAPALAALASTAPLGQSRHRPEHYRRQGEGHGDCQPSGFFHITSPS
jgi:hypothetical protein